MTDLLTPGPADASDDLARWEALAPRADTRDLAASARSHFASVDPLGVLRGALSGVAPPDRWKLWADAGYPEVGIPEESGGAGDAVDLAVLLEEAGRALVGDSLLASCVATAVQHRSGLPDGELLLSRGAYGAGSGHVAGGRVHASGVPVLDGASAALFTLLLTRGRDTRMVVVASTAPGLTVRPHVRDHDPTRPWVTVDLDGVKPVVAIEVDDPSAAEAAARVCVAADLTGVAAAALDRSVEHARSRHQFGQPIGAFQAIKHQLADGYVAVERARSLTLGAAVELATDPASRRTLQLALLAGAAAGEAASAESARFVQLLGAMGVTFEADAHLYFRRTHQTVLALGPSRSAYRRAAELEVRP
jgi:alkylation response protein AidB-like acyl-CoA dehydrogenase